jgi:hypothetical protein
MSQLDLYHAYYRAGKAEVTEGLQRRPVRKEYPLRKRVSNCIILAIKPLQKPPGYIPSDPQLSDKDRLNKLETAYRSSSVLSNSMQIWTSSIPLFKSTERPARFPPQIWKSNTTAELNNACWSSRTCQFVGTLGIENLLELEGKVSIRVDSLFEEYGNNFVPQW